LIIDFKLIVTVGEALTGSPEKLKKIDSLGSCIYRINGAHVSPEHLPETVKNIRSILKKPRIMIDLPGNKVRLNGISEPIRLKKGERFLIHDFQLNYPKFVTHLKKGDIMLANDSTVKMEIIGIKGRSLNILSHSDGILHKNRGLHVPHVHGHIPFLFQRDVDLIKQACKLKIDYLSLSFVRKADDVREAKALLKRNRGADMEIFAKIETGEALENLGYIFREVGMINIDRGDLSSDIGLLKLSGVQERVIDSAKRAGKKVFLATQFLKNMEKSPVPLIAEIMDLFKTIKSGVSGIQLSEETAIGLYPVECVKLVFDIYNQSFSG